MKISLNPKRRQFIQNNLIKKVKKIISFYIDCDSNSNTRKVNFDVLRNESMTFLHFTDFNDNVLN